MKKEYLRCKECNYGPCYLEKQLPGVDAGSINICMIHSSFIEKWKEIPKEEWDKETESKLSKQEKIK